MTSTITDREKIFENKFMKDEELQFKVHSRADRLFGLWAAGKLGKSGNDAKAYADSIIDSDVDNHGLAKVMRLVQKDFAAKGIEMSAHHLENEYNVHLATAKKELM